ncbi:LolA-like putative outer membrane lipoprotein chaperone [Parabacteroides sp. PF5-6]|uniref:LolA family protein n=1 Tax=Parabacteroides sp. PF5-6 TaxID=1742403 RepID=UPI0024070F57|nr:LolA-like putative outer membrane lipoprotein chaperone [Parabacteroides sp. PF5-6]MDF9829047.1 outer membrane lipoprotein-sorting protein [Parabacteroides sp. PF5-6]
MKRYLYIICIILCWGSVFPVWAQKGGDILDKAAETYEKSNGISASFAFHTRNDAQHISESFEGIIQMRGDKFAFATPDMQVWYDGKTQWTYVERNEEVYVTEPTGDELQLTNPAVLLRTYKKGYEAKYIGESTSASGKTAYDVELTPRKKGDIVRVSLQIEKISSFPVRIVIEDKNATRTMIQIDKLTFGVNQSDHSFVFNKENYPEADIIGLP